MKNEFLIAPEGLGLRDVDVWTKIYDAKTYGTVISARIVRRREIVGYGSTWEIEFPEIPGATGLIPQSQAGLPEGTSMSAFVGLLINVMVIGVDRDEGIVACSRQEAVDLSLTKLLTSVGVGSEIPAVVKFVRSSNIYLDIGGGIIIKIPSEKARLSPGVQLDVQYMCDDIINVVVTAADKPEKVIRVELVNIWERWILARGEILMGTVVATREKMAFIRVKPGIVGLVSYNAWDDYQIGDQATFQVNVYDPQSRKLHLTSWDHDKARIRRKTLTKAKARRDNQRAAAYPGY